MSRRLAMPLLIVLVAGTGCVRRSAGEFAMEAEPETVVAPLAPVAVREVTVAYDGPPEQPLPDAPRAVVAQVPPALLPPSEPVLFRLGAGYGALGQVDLGPCRAPGLQPGYLRMRVTFRHSGRVVRVAIEMPVAPPDEALACIGEQLKAAMVPVFDGGDVTLSKSFFVPAGGAPFEGIAL